MVRSGLLAAILLIVLTPLPASADLCGQLGRELKATQSQGQGAGARKYRVAADRQRAALAETERRIRAGGCGGAFGRGGACGALLDAATRMKSNLASLEAMAGRGSGAGEVRRAEIRAQMKAAGCTSPAAETTKASAAKPATGKTFVPPGRGQYRTLCVRLCDGYYYPISWSATKKDFAGNEAACRATCPGAETALYVHPTGAESTTAISLSGQPYLSLPNALAYRKTLSPDCGCRAAPGNGPGALAFVPPHARPGADRPAERVIALDTADMRGPADDLAALIGNAPAAGAMASVAPEQAAPTVPLWPVRRVGPASLYVQ